MWEEEGFAGRIASSFAGSECQKKNVAAAGVNIAEATLMVHMDLRSHACVSRSTFLLVSLRDDRRRFLHWV